jgi:hypothetical protein
LGFIAAAASLPEEIMADLPGTVLAMRWKACYASASNT